MDFPIVRLKQEREWSVRQGHPWIFSGAIHEAPKKSEVGALVRVVSGQGEFLCIGYYFPERSIAVRVLSKREVSPDTAFWEQKFQRAKAVRELLGLVGNEVTNAFRVLNSEGDFVPGLIVDLYVDTAVFQMHHEGIESQREALEMGFRKVWPQVQKIVWRNASPSKNEDAQASAQSEIVEILENGLRFKVDVTQGQKTGFFLDQRDNRLFVSQCASGRNVLNTFSYTGGFSIAALVGGAERVDSVEASKSAAEMAESNVRLNSTPDDDLSSKHKQIVGDCFEVLADLPKEYDLIVVDPPAFMKHQRASTRGKRGYESINEMALKLIRPGGLYFTFSCSQLLPMDEFKSVIAAASARAKRRARVLQELRQAPCHPVDIQHREGQYLKGLLLMVE